MGVVRAPVQTVEEIYRLVWTAVENKQPIEAMYQGRLRLFCPHRLGRNRQGRLRVLCYQYGGESRSGLQPVGLACKLALCCTGETQQGEVNRRMLGTRRRIIRGLTSCVAEADIDAEDHPERDPQKGQ